jgi:glycolate oxidase iron-sulfur subunit
VLFPRANDATIDLLRRHGCSVVEIDGCCGALQRHAGFDHVESISSAAREDWPVITNSAGCGSAMKEHPDASFASRVRDISEYFCEIGFSPPTKGDRIRVAYHDACHLAHSQGIRNQPRSLLRAMPGVELVEIAESDRCCGSAGIYNITQPTLARELLARKWESIDAAAPDVVVMGNPGCLGWIRQSAEDAGSSIRVEHIATFLSERYATD